MSKIINLRSQNPLDFNTTPAFYLRGYGKAKFYQILFCKNVFKYVWEYKVSKERINISDEYTELYYPRTYASFKNPLPSSPVKEAKNWEWSWESCAKEELIGIVLFNKVQSKPNIFKSHFYTKPDLSTIKSWVSSSQFVHLIFT